MLIQSHFLLTHCDSFKLIEENHNVHYVIPARPSLYVRTEQENAFQRKLLQIRDDEIFVLNCIQYNDGG